MPLQLSDWIGPAISAFGSIGGGLLGSKAQQDTSQQNIAATERMQDKALSAYTGGSEFQETIKTPEGGFKVTQPGGKDAALSRSILAGGDIGRALDVNRLDRDLNFTLPTMQSARDVITGENLRNQGQFQQGLDKIIKARTRSGGGIQTPGSQFEGATAQAIGDYARSKPMGGEVAAMDLYNKSRVGDVELKNAIKNSLARQVPAPGFTGGAGPGASAAQVLAQMPLPAKVPDLSSALPFYGISDAVGGAQASAQRREDMDRMERMYQNRYAQPGFSAQLGNDWL
jgi:hypothetical protein